MSLRILIVENNHPLAITLMKGLENAFSQKVQVDISCSKIQTFSIINQKIFDLILSDEQISGISSLELLQSIRQAQPKAFLILLTAYEDNEIDYKAKQVVNMYITKPFDLPFLTNQVKYLFDTPRISQNGIY